MIDAIVFDIGGVLVNFSHEPFRQFLLDHGAPVRSQDEYIKATRLFEYESGKISRHSFLNGLRELTNGNVDNEELISQWSKDFSPNEPMLDLLDQVKGQKQVYILSNTNELHWEFLNKEYNLANRVHGFVVSFQAGVMKPDPKIYRHFTDTFGFRPDALTFIDDREDNAQASRAAGWADIYYQSFERTVRSLADLGCLPQA